MSTRVVRPFKAEGNIRCMDLNGNTYKYHSWKHFEWRKIVEGLNAGMWQEILRCRHNCGKHKLGKVIEGELHE